MDPFRDPFRQAMMGLSCPRTAHALNPAARAAKEPAMPRTKTILSLVMLAALPLVGCVSAEEYDRTAEAARTLQMRNDQLAQEKSQLEDMLAKKQARIEEVERANLELVKLSDEMKKQLDAYGMDLNKFGDKINGLNLAQLDPATNAELMALAAQYPDLMSYDGTRGMIRLNADLTFDSGSDQVKDAARSALGRLAGVLNDSNAGKYDIRLVGHTDRQPISNPATRSKFGTNRVLSCFRAIAVEKALTGFGVNASRMECSGWGEYMPAVDSPSLNVRENRRVEIFLVPATGGKASAAPESSAARETPRKPAEAPKREEMPFK